MFELKRLIGSVTRQLYASAFIRCVLLAVSAFLLAFALTQSSVMIAILAGVIGLGIGIWVTKLYQNKKPQAISLIHQTIGESEYSLHLLEKEELNIAEQLQLDRLNQNVQTTRLPFGKIYDGLTLYGALLIGSLAVYFVYPKLDFSTKADRMTYQQTRQVKKANVLVPPTFQTANVRVGPPAYTGLPVKETADLNVSAIVGSSLQWNITFSHQDNLSVRLANSRGDELVFKKFNGSFEYRDRLTGSGLYSIKAYWKDSLVYQSDFYKLEAQPDLAPKIEPDSKELYQYHFLKDNKTIQVSAKITDDFKVKQAFIVATLARGSGENVKFREMKFPLTPANFKEAKFNKAIDLKALNFTPGDELYYYWAAIDNREPEANFTKSDTYFIVYKDTAKVEESELATMSVNTVPEYFRSQRQIIIDTEKLIARRKKIKKEEFNSISNEIGFDQKVLRLRYGQFLGEEFEQNIGGGGGDAPHDEGHVESGNVLDKFTHKSDSEGEAAENRKAQPKPHHHDHGAESHADAGSKDAIAELMEQYVHAHDDAEINTFHEQSTKSLLKMALEQMWQSELHLRLYEPEKALPFENKALEFLKQAQHKARAFVKKSSYDPPPIKEKEKRLSGELTDLSKNFSAEKVIDKIRTEQLAAEVLGYLEYEKLSVSQRAKFQVAGTQLSNRLINSGPFNGGLQNWSVLGALQKLISGKLISAKEKQQLKTELYKRSGANVQSGRSYASEKKLENIFWKKLK
ncbi:SoxR reducing system RseC family protein [Dyadobacter sp. LHD-138]|uniref:SoxR reducing system RseC family protein n=1 Tax=Dyadobacter sp. LHD-138 TaxID=3071413 RepID=UPI0027DF7D8F|nr:SoxR reducing system RseC family protein [Dyadobacter sp. LHD-138]MDQ6479144.1 SoxR reducing system RseC family protein [Dyadobacter sp. LHD-138]